MPKDFHKIIVVGGGTFSPVRNHLSLCAPAFGTTANYMYNYFKDNIKDIDYMTPYLVKTKMAGGKDDLKTNEDVEKFIDKCIEDDQVGTIVLNVAFCDYDVIDEKSGWHGERLKTSEGNISLELTPSKKIIDKIRRKRPDIFLIGFKTTTNATDEEQFLTALKMMKRSKCNIVLANDTVTRKNMIITPEESKYQYETREETLNELCDMILKRNDLTYNRTNFIEKENVPITEANDNFVEVMEYLVENGGYIENNGNGFTPGHFCFRYKEGFVSSQRKVNHNEVFERGMTYVTPSEEGKFKAEGTHKPSVGARSQWLMLEENEDFDFVVHTHNPLKKGSEIPLASQKPFQCGSLECGLNTLNNLGDFGDIKAVYLDKHGANIIFQKSTPASTVIDFIEENIELGVKTT